MLAKGSGTRLLIGVPLHLLHLEVELEFHTEGGSKISSILPSFKVFIKTFPLKENQNCLFYCLKHKTLLKVDL